MLKVLLVDDEFLVRLAFSNTINWEEHNLNLIGTASNGVEAYDIIRKEQPDIVITDLTMPQMGGLELIEKVQASGFKCEFVVLSCHNEFEYAKQSLKLGVFDYILKLSMNMNELLDVLDRLRDKIILEKQDTSEILEIFEHQEMEHFEFRVVVIGTDEAEAGEQDKVNEQVVGIVEQITGKIQSKSVFIYKNMPVLLFWDKINGLTQLLHDIQSEIKKYLDIEVEIGIGSKVCGNTLIKESFNKAITAYQHRFYNGEASITFYEDMGYKDGEELDFTDIFPGISAALKLGIRQELKTAIQLRLEQIQAEQQIEPTQLRMYLHELLTRMKLKADEQIPGAINGSFYSDTYQKVHKLEYLEDINEELLYFLDMILEHLDGLKEHELVRNAKQYVHAHLSEDLRVIEISRYLGVNPDYLSHLFRTETGIRYIDYVNRIRIERACERLRISHDKIYEIAEQCGFENTNYFIKVFKKHVGFTPLEYKKEQENIEF